jgi:hypothetical protein
MKSMKKSKKSTKNSRKNAQIADSPRPAKRKRIMSLAQYEAELARPDAVPDPVLETPTPATALAADVTPRAKKSGEAGQSAKARKPSGLDAAVEVLREAGTPLNCGEMVKQMLERGLWATGGKTPAATIYAAIIREIATRGDKSRFRKTDRGMFELAQ